MLTIEAIPAFSDNYIWMIGAPGRSAVAVVDPGDPAPVLEVLERNRLDLVGILLTHHHADHVGGVGALLERRAAPVFGPAGEAIPGVDNPVRGDEVVALADLELYLRVVDVPGHTAGHVAYVGPDFALVGDALFAGGCGRVFEGTMEQMHESLNRLATLPPETAIHCAHEYTVANLRFAGEVEPDNRALGRRLADAIATRVAGHPTVPSRLADELATNPFLRCGESSVVAAAERHAGRPLASEAEVFAVIRQWKDGWQS